MCVHERRSFQTLIIILTENDDLIDAHNRVRLFFSVRTFIFFLLALFVIIALLIFR